MQTWSRGCSWLPAQLPTQSITTSTAPWAMPLATEFRNSALFDLRRRIVVARDSRPPPGPTVIAEPRAWPASPWQNLGAKAVSGQQLPKVRPPSAPAWPMPRHLRPTRGIWSPTPARRSTAAISGPTSGRRAAELGRATSQRQRGPCARLARAGGHTSAASRRLCVSDPAVCSHPPVVQLHQQLCCHRLPPKRSRECQAQAVQEVCLPLRQPPVLPPSGPLAPAWAESPAPARRHRQYRSRMQLRPTKSANPPPMQKCGGVSLSCPRKCSQFENMLQVLAPLALPPLQNLERTRSRQSPWLVNNAAGQTTWPRACDAKPWETTAGLPPER
mmetsp:Transcript_38209/g.109711  ORF Transcript_38209/g.109711 Transcript_38209/m.109711 type:complete len:330 (-) Transcript_38209:39-1028(-)